MKRMKKISQTKKKYCGYVSHTEVIQIWEDIITNFQLTHRIVTSNNKGQSYSYNGWYFKKCSANLSYWLREFDKIHIKK